MKKYKVKERITHIRTSEIELDNNENIIDVVSKGDYDTGAEEFEDIDVIEIKEEVLDY